MNRRLRELRSLHGVFPRPAARITHPLTEIFLQRCFILRQAEEGTAVGEVCRKAGISETTYYNRRKKYAGLMPSEPGLMPSKMKRPRLLEEENGKLKRIVVDLSLDKAMLQDVIRRKL